MMRVDMRAAVCPAAGWVVLFIPKEAPMVNDGKHTNRVTIWLPTTSTATSAAWQTRRTERIRKWLGMVCGASCMGI